MTREEAINKVRQMSLSREIMDILEALAPELKKSDEEIRKQLIGFISDVKRISESGRSSWAVRKGDVEMCNAFLAYLEKQKEQKPAEHSCSNDNSEYDKGYMDGKAFQLKQTEQYSIGKTFMGLIPCWVNAPSTLQPAHKYHGRNAVIMHENNGGFRCCFIDDEKATTIHLPENTGFVEGWREESTKQNEEDITNGWKGADLDRYLSCLHRLGTGNPQQPETSNSKWFREHCRPQPDWKPSEEQMKALYSAVNDAISLYSNKVSPLYEEISRTHFDALDSLYNDLKKLI